MIAWYHGRMGRHPVLCLTLVAAAAAVRLTGGDDPPALALAEKEGKPRPEPPPDTSHKDPGPPRDGQPRTDRYPVTFFDLDTREVLPVTEDAGPGADEMSRFLRRRTTGRRNEMALAPVKVAVRMAERVEAHRVEVISGYRSEKLNESLRKQDRPVSSRSRHVRGQALDFRIPGVPAPELARAVAAVHEGAIGTYRESDFLHVDVGPDRRRQGR